MNRTDRTAGALPRLPAGWSSAARLRLVARLSLAARLRLVACLAPSALLVLGGCAPTLPVIVKAIDCPVPADLLAQRCDAPRPVPDGISYADVIAIGIDDRKALQACAAHDKLLAAMILECQRTIKDYNERLVEINQKIATKP